MNGTAPRLRGDALRAVRHRGSHLQILASAGSGKTEVGRSASPTFASGVGASGVVVFTFTERAAEALKSRIELRCDVRPLCRFAATDPASSARPRGRRAGSA